ncbi:hypothetical protein M8J76_003753 [Diaphorina citri]|nr:hypothetical protein M8J76_003753 [Diaphorina citri]
MNKNMLNKIHSYNMLRRDLHSKLVENEIDTLKYNEILGKKFHNLFKNINQEEKKNFLNLINYLKMFNFDNKKLYNSLHDGNDLFKLINDNKIKYLPFMNSDKTLPDLFTNNKVNKEMKRILIQYKISSKDLYDKLINKINPFLLEDMNKNIQSIQSENKAQIEEVETKNPYQLLKERIEDLTSFNKKPKILPLNEKISLSNKNNVDMKADTKVQKKEVDASLNKYIKHLRLLNAIEQERSELVNRKIEDLINPNKNKEQQKIAILQPNPNAELLALYIVLSIPGVISSLKNKMKEQHIKKRKEEILQNSHVEAGKLYNYLMNENVQGSLKKIHNFVKKEKHLNHLTGFNINPNHFKDEKNIQADKKNLEEQIEMKRHPFGHENSDPLIHDDNYYDAPVIPEYQNRPYGHKNDFKIDAHNLYSILRKKDKANLLNDREHYAIEGNDLFNILSKSLPKNSKTQDVYKIDGHQLKSHLLQKAQNNEPIHELKESFDHKIDGNVLLNLLRQPKPNDGLLNKNIRDEQSIKTKDSMHAANDNKNTQNHGDFIDGNTLFNILKDSNKDILGETMKNKNINVENDAKQIKGQDLFHLLKPRASKVDVNNEEIGLDKMYKNLYNAYLKDNKGVIGALDAKKKNEVFWDNQNVEIPNISSLNVNDNTKQNPVRAGNEEPQG